MSRLHPVRWARRELAEGWRLAQTRTGIFFWQLGVLWSLLAVAALDLDRVFSLPAMLGSVPLAVPWFGAVGAVVISLTGTFEHTRTWNVDYAFWHWSRPFIGATLAVVAVLILQAGILAVGSTPTTHVGATTPRNLLYYVVAFAVGYREETFRALLRRLLDVLLSPGEPGGASPAVLAVAPNAGPLAGRSAVGITGAGLSQTRAVKFGALSARFEIDSDHHLTTTSPQATSPGPVTITVQLMDRSLTGPTYSYEADAAGV
jgi:hypothetical protein